MAKRQHLRAPDQFEKRLQVLSRIYGFVGPLSIIAVCVIIDYLFTNYFRPGQRGGILAIIAVFVVALLARLVGPKGSRVRTAIEYTAVTVVGIIALNFFAHFPSPFIMVGAIIAIPIYFDFGFTWTTIGLGAVYGSVLVHAIWIHSNLVQFVDVIVFILTPVAMAVFIMRLVTLSRQEIDSIKASHAQADAQEQRVQSLINNITDGVIAVDHELKVMIYNAAALDVLDINVAMTGKKITNFFKPIDKDKKAIDLTELLNNTQAPVVNRDLRITYNDGSNANLFIGIAPIYLGYGKSANNGFTLILRDITREKSLEEERDEFISVVSHELRTPITIAEGNISNAQLIADNDAATYSIKTSLQEAHNQVLFLADMINDLATLSRAERGKLDINIEPLSVPDLVNELVTSYGPEATAKGLALVSEVDPRAKTLASSKLYVKEVLQNFITNSIKYTAQGSVTIKVTAIPTGMRFDIIDTGIGISKGDQERVFDKFFRSEDYRTRQASGTGLGLYVTMKLARMLHADIDLQSELDKGSTFTITIPNLS